MHNQKKYRLQKISENNSSPSTSNFDANSPLLRHKANNRLSLTGVKQSYIYFFKQEEKNQQSKSDQILVKEKDQIISKLQEKLLKKTVEKTSMQNRLQSRHLTVVNKKEFQNSFRKMFAILLRMGGLQLKETLKLVSLFCLYLKNGKKVGRKGVVIELVRAVLVWVRNVFGGVNKLINRNLGIE